MRLLILSLLFLLSGLTIQAQNVYVTKTGGKFHKETCRYLKHSKKTITLEKALELGYEACFVCKPTKATGGATASKSDFSSSNSLHSSSSNKKATATQCTGKTQSGRRCKRMTKNASGRCYQHI